MKKNILIITMLVGTLAGCQGVTNDGKDKEQRPNYDTTDPVESINSTGTMKDSVMRNDVK